MNRIELNKILIELTTAARLRLNLSVENAVAFVMLSKVANDLQMGLIAERDIKKLLDAMIAEVNLKEFQLARYYNFEDAVSQSFVADEG